MLLGSGAAPAAVINAGSEAQESAIDAGGDDSRVGSRTGWSAMDDAGGRDPRLPAVKSKGEALIQHRSVYNCVQRRASVSEL